MTAEHADQLAARARPRRRRSIPALVLPTPETQAHLHLSRAEEHMTIRLFAHRKKQTRAPGRDPRPRRRTSSGRMSLAWDRAARRSRSVPAQLHGASRRPPLERDALGASATRRADEKRGRDRSKPPRGATAPAPIARRGAGVGRRGDAALPARARASAGRRCAATGHAGAEGALLRRSSRTWTPGRCKWGAYGAHRAGRGQRRRGHPHELPQGRQRTGSSTGASATSRTARARRGTSSSRRSIRRSAAPGTAPSSSRRARPASSVGKIEEKMGLRASETAELVLEDCRVPEENLLGGEEAYVTKEGFMTAMKTFDNTRPLVGRDGDRHRARGVRVRARLREGQLRPVAARSRATRRSPSVSRRSAASSRRRARCVWRAAWHGRHRASPTRRRRAWPRPPRGRRRSARASRRSRSAAPHGSIATEHQLLEKWFRDIKVYDIFEGTGQIQRVVISKRDHAGAQGVLAATLGSAAARGACPLAHARGSGPLARARGSETRASEGSPLAYARGSEACLAERAGFEPAVGFRYTRFPVVHLRPLGHLSRTARPASLPRAAHAPGSWMRGARG